MTGAELWWITLGAVSLVVGVVAVLFALIVRTARRIGAVLREVWITGQSVANNTAHLDLLRRSAVECEEILACLQIASEHAGHKPNPSHGR